MEISSFDLSLSIYVVSPIIVRISRIISAAELGRHLSKVQRSWYEFGTTLVHIWVEICRNLVGGRGDVDTIFC